MGKQLGDKLKELRGQRDWTQQELAKRSGVKRGYLASIEAGLVKNPSALVFLRLASAFGISPDELYHAAGYIGDGRSMSRGPGTLEEIIDQLKTVQPAAIPLYRWGDFPAWEEESPPPLDYIYRAKSRALGRKMTAYVVQGIDYEPAISENDIIVVDRDEPFSDGEMVACRLEGMPVIGRLREVGGECYLETAGRRTRFDECEAPAEIIEIRKWLEERDKSAIL